MSAVIEITNNQTNQKRTLTEREIWDQQDFVDNTVHELIETLCGRKIEWDISITGDVRDAIIKSLEYHKLTTEDEMYPYVEERQPETDDCQPVRASDGMTHFIQECKENPLKTGAEFFSIVLVFLAIFYGLPMIAAFLGY